MNKYLQLPVEIAINRYSTQVELRMAVHPNALRDLCLGLCLLADSLIEKLTISDQQQRMKVQFMLARGIEHMSRVRIEHTVSVVELARNQLDYARQFFLKYYRDGAADVNHIHLESRDSATDEQDIDVTFAVSESAPPVSASEAEKRLRS